MGRDHTQGRHREGIRQTGYRPCFAASTGYADATNRDAAAATALVAWLEAPKLLAAPVYMPVGGRPVDG